MAVGSKPLYLEIHAVWGLLEGPVGDKPEKNFQVLWVLRTWWWGFRATL